MKWFVELEVKDHIRDWSNQNIEMDYNSITAIINIQDRRCGITLEGDDVEESFYLIWELLFLYDGYFYKPLHFWENDIEKDVKQLLRFNFYETSKQWYNSELLGRGNRNLSSDVISKYATLRNTGMKQKKMTKAVVNAFFYLHSEGYEKINSNHRLSLFLNIGDGFILNSFKETNNVKANFDRLFKKTVDIQKLRKGISLLGMPDEQFRYNLAEERNVFDHYIFSENSIATFIYKSDDSKSNCATWFFIYVLELVLRINFLREIGVEIEQEIKDYALDVIVDWVIFVNDIDVDCTTPIYKMRQLGKEMEKS